MESEAASETSYLFLKKLAYEKGPKKEIRSEVQ